ncbi:response regulator [Paenibacillus aceti]|uniref:response regulator n=1 Tax=Paenibacillus aceti TaxID=1820010 RepID=UPI001F08E5F2|nr:response regulator [Paenibacillus aceti]
MKRGMGLKVIIVDDESLAILKMETLLREQTEVDIELAGSYMNPLEALAAARREVLHLAFLDIEMPEITGFELANQLLNIQPHIEIVFTTAFQEYALKAFEINALDYLLKPVSPDRLVITLQRIAKAAGELTDRGNEANAIQLNCFRNIHYVDADGTTKSFACRTLKAPEIFAYLLFHHDTIVTKQSLIDLLWPEYDIDKATAQLHTAIYQIRKVLKEAEFELEIKYKDGGYSLLLGDVKLDVEDWESRVKKARPVTADTMGQHLSILSLYKGDYLADHRYTWAEYEQERLRLIWLTHVKQLAEYCLSSEMYTEAMSLYQEIVYRLPYVEDGYLGLMKVYSISNHQLEVRKVYRILCTKLRDEFDVAPSRELTNWYLEWKQSI